MAAYDKGQNLGGRCGGAHTDVMRQAQRIHAEGKYRSAGVQEHSISEGWQGQTSEDSPPPCRAAMPSRHAKPVYAYLQEWRGHSEVLILNKDAEEVDWVQIAEVSWCMATPGHNSHGTPIQC